jgi:hypothetical protein
MMGMKMDPILCIRKTIMQQLFDFEFFMASSVGAVQKGELLSFFRKNQNSQMKALCASMFLCGLK